MRNNQAARREERAVIASLARDLAALPLKSTGELAEQYLGLFNEPTRSRNKGYLVKRIGWRLQEIAEGGLSPRALAQIEALAPLAPVRWQPRPSTQPVATPVKRRDPRVPPPGQIIRRTQGDTEYQVKVLENGFEYEGKVFRSLSGIARHITGVSWNGYRFFFGSSETANMDRAGDR
ncbi:MAG TPA: DUF2924 domain-containing protein [Kofleriaceae bacterium]|nr:DUF2924 domain-containing protein [Kofleriaceae bacterium]